MILATSRARLYALTAEPPPTCPPIPMPDGFLATIKQRGQLNRYLRS